MPGDDHGLAGLHLPCLYLPTGSDWPDFARRLVAHLVVNPDLVQEATFYNGGPSNPKTVHTLILAPFPVQHRPDLLGDPTHGRNQP